MFQKTIEKIESNPKKLFLIDGFGAILSAFLLGFVLVKLEKLVGIPTSTLYFLAALPICFALYDFYCYQKESDKLGQFLKAIALLNLVYCCLSIGIAFYHFGTLTNLGWTYILIEVLIVITLAILELKVAKTWTRNYNKTAQDKSNNVKF
ncbi:MAG: putative flippase GtrA [Crocinitomicaceae bacterium]|jgi:putative flippase GtrA